MTARRAAAYGSPVSAIRRRAAALILSCDIVPSSRQPVPAPGHRRVVTMEGKEDRTRGLCHSCPHRCPSAGLVQLGSGRRACRSSAYAAAAANNGGGSLDTVRLPELVPGRCHWLPVSSPVAGDGGSRRSARTHHSAWAARGGEPAMTASQGFFELHLPGGPRTDQPAASALPESSPRLVTAKEPRGVV